MVAGAIDWKVGNGDCIGGYFQDHYDVDHYNVNVLMNIHVSIRKGMAEINWPKKNLILEDGFSCNLYDYKCFNIDYGYTFWGIINTTTACYDNKLIILYNGKANETIDSSSIVRIFVMHEDLNFFVKVGEKLRICNYKMYSTQLSNIYIFYDSPEINFKSDNIFLQSDDTHISKKNYILSNTIDMKSGLPIRKVHEVLNQFIHDENYLNCIQNLEETKIKLEQIRANPDKFGELIHGKFGYRSVIEGDNIFVVECDPVLVTLRKTKKQCFKEIPVTHEGKDKFLLPSSRFIVENGTLTHCPSKILRYYNIGNKIIQLNSDGDWVILNGTGILSEFPMREIITIGKIETNEPTASIYGILKEKEFFDDLITPIKIQATKENFLYVLTTNQKNESFPSDINLENFIPAKYKEKLETIQKLLDFDFSSQMVFWGILAVLAIYNAPRLWRKLNDIICCKTKKSDHIETIYRSS